MGSRMACKPARVKDMEAQPGHSTRCVMQCTAYLTIQDHQPMVLATRYISRVEGIVLTAANLNFTIYVDMRLPVSDCDRMQMAQRLAPCKGWLAPAVYPVYAHPHRHQWYFESQFALRLLMVAFKIGLAQKVMMDIEDNSPLPWPIRFIQFSWFQVQHMLILNHIDKPWPPVQPQLLLQQPVIKQEPPTPQRQRQPPPPQRQQQPPTQQETQSPEQERPAKRRRQQQVPLSSLSSS